MSNIFITYSDEAFRIPKLRLRSQAKHSKKFDRIITYSPNDLPLYLKSSPLAHYRKGGGYWMWKPWVILDALSKAVDGDIIYYCDSGCRLNPESDEWGKFDQILKTHNAIFFRYRNDEHYFWDMYKINSTKIKHWIKPTAVDYFREYCGNDDFLEFDKIMAASIIVKKVPGMRVFDEWMRICLFRPDLFMDPMGEELNNLPDYFNEHRHDQSLITVLAHHYQQRDGLVLLDETLESRRDTAAIVAERYHVGRLSTYLRMKTELFYFIDYYL